MNLNSLKYAKPNDARYILNLSWFAYVKSFRFHNMPSSHIHCAMLHTRQMATVCNIISRCQHNQQQRQRQRQQQQQQQRRLKRSDERSFKAWNRYKTDLGVNLERMVSVPCCARSTAPESPRRCATRPTATCNRAACWSPYGRWRRSPRSRATVGYRSTFRQRYSRDSCNRY